MRKVSVNLVDQYWDSSNSIYMYGSMGRVIGLSAKGENYLLWLDNGDKVEVDQHRQLIAIDLNDHIVDMVTAHA